MRVLTVHHKKSQPLISSHSSPQPPFAWTYLSCPLSDLASTCPVVLALAFLALCVFQLVFTKQMSMTKALFFPHASIFIKWTKISPAPVVWCTTSVRDLSFSPICYKGGQIGEREGRLRNGLLEHGGRGQLSRLPVPTPTPLISSNRSEKIRVRWMDEWDIFLRPRKVEMVTMVARKRNAPQPCLSCQLLMSRVLDLVKTQPPPQFLLCISAFHLLEIYLQCSLAQQTAPRFKTWLIGWHCRSWSQNRAILFPVSTKERLHKSKPG